MSRHSKVIYQTDTQTDRQKDRHTDTQTNTHTDSMKTHYLPAYAGGKHFKINVLGHQER